MRPTLTPGAEPSTLMGPGWRPRVATHAAEIGTVWASCGVSRETDPLRAVLLAWPGDLDFEGEPADQLMHAWPDLGRMREQATAIAEFYASQGVEVHWMRDGRSPNVVFARDLFFMTPEGAILGRMAARQREGEERVAAAALATLGVPLLGMPRGTATFEGADALWVRPDLVLIGTGRRTDEAGAAHVAGILATMGVRTVTAPIPSSVQHLLGAVNFVATDTALVVEIGPELERALADAGVKTLLFGPDEEVDGTRSTNVVCLRSGEVVLPGPSPRTRERLEALGIRTHALDVDQYLRAAGGMGCLTGILRRG